MQVTVLFFAAARDAVGHAQVEVALPESIHHAAGLLEWLGGRFPALLPHLGCLRIAHNERFVQERIDLKSGDILAIIPPVAGG